MLCCPVCWEFFLEHESSTPKQAYGFLHPVATVEIGILDEATQMFPHQPQNTAVAVLSGTQSPLRSVVNPLFRPKPCPSRRWIISIFIPSSYEHGLVTDLHSICIEMLSLLLLHSTYIGIDELLAIWMSYFTSCRKPSSKETT